MLRTSKAIPRTPLEVTMAKLQQAEAEHLRDRVQMKRELDQQHRRASSLEHRYSQVQVTFPSQLTWHQLGGFSIVTLA